MSGHLGSLDIKLAPAFCGQRIGLFKGTTGWDGGGGGNAASLPILWVWRQPVRLHNSCLALGQNHNSGHMFDVRISDPGSLVAMETRKGREGRLLQGCGSMKERERETAGKRRWLEDGRQAWIPD